VDVRTKRFHAEPLCADLKGVMHEITGRHHSVGRDEDGFTLIEVLVAAVLLLVGILGVATMVNAANGTTTSNKAREQGLALGRELIESARSSRYQSLRPAALVGTLQAIPGFANAGAGQGWTIRRRGIVYTVSVGVCSVDDAGDRTGAHVGGAFCSRPTVQANAARCRSLVGTPASISGTGAAGLDAGDCGLDTNLDGQVDGLVDPASSSCPAGSSVAAGTCDPQPDDFKRLVTLVTWDRGSGSRFVLQQATVPFPGLSAYGAVTDLTLRGGYALQADGYLVADKAAALTFDAQTSQQANQVNWLLGGVDQGQATWSGSSGWFTWNLGNDAPESETTPAQAQGEVVDGTYTVGARVQDGGGIHGIERDVTVKLNRRKPFPPPSFSIAVTAGSVTASWGAPPDRDILGYRLVRLAGGGTPISVCGDITERICTDPNPPSGGVDYWAVALDTAPDGSVREGQASAKRPYIVGNVPPTTPTIIGADASVAGKVVLTWKASTDVDDPVDAYEVYRSGCTANTLVGTALGTATTLTDFGVPSKATCVYNVRAKDLGGTYSNSSPDYSVKTA
jgi:prepilin-type N-terminal cleavage/methylation domain-containing protein